MGCLTILLILAVAVSSSQLGKIYYDDEENGNSAGFSRTIEVTEERVEAAVEPLDNPLNFLLSLAKKLFGLFSSSADGLVSQQVKSIKDKTKNADPWILKHCLVDDKIKTVTGLEYQGLNELKQCMTAVTDNAKKDNTDKSGYNKDNDGSEEDSPKKLHKCLSDSVNGLKKSLSLVDAELVKCLVQCQQCHYK